MKRSILIILFALSFLLCSNNQFNTTVNWTSYSYSMPVKDITGDMEYIYIASNTSIIAIDKYTDKIFYLLAFRHGKMKDFPFDNIIADKYSMYNIYFTGRKYIYHYDWLSDTLYYTKIGNQNALKVQQIGVDNQYLYVRIDNHILRTLKYELQYNKWEVINDTLNIPWKENNKDFTNIPELLPNNIVFQNHIYDFTCYYNDMNTYWIGTKGAGIVKYDNNTKTRKHIMYSTGTIDSRAFCLDSSGAMWIAGLRTIFITRYFPDGDSFHYYRVSDIMDITDNDITSISSSKNTILFGTNNGEIFYYSFLDSSFHDIKGEKTGIVFRTAPINDSLFLISNNKGIAFIDLNTNKFYQDNSMLMSSIIDLLYYNDTIYIVSKNQIYFSPIDSIHFIKKEFDFPTFNIYQYYKNDSIEIVLDNAYIHIKKYNDNFNSYPVVGMFGDLWDMTFDKDNIWICGRDGIGRFFINENRWKIYNMKNSHLPGTFVLSILSYNGYLYGGNQNAFFKFFFSNPLLNE